MTMWYQCNALTNFVTTAVEYCTTLFWHHMVMGAILFKSSCRWGPSTVPWLVVWWKPSLTRSRSSGDRFISSSVAKNLSPWLVVIRASASWEPIGSAVVAGVWSACAGPPCGEELRDQRWHNLAEWSLRCVAPTLEMRLLPVQSGSAYSLLPTEAIKAVSWLIPYSWERDPDEFLSKQSLISSSLDLCNERPSKA